jgi:hypothetical protein
MGYKLRSMGLAFVAICAFCAVSAGVAQGAPHWTVDTSNPFTGQEAVSATTTLTPRVAGESPATASLTVPGLGITLTGTGFSTQNGVIEQTYKSSATSFSITGITVSGAAGCRVRNVGGTFGTLKSEAFTGELSAVGSEADILLTPVGTNFVTVEIGKVEGKTCAVSGTYPITGVLAADVPIGTMNTTFEKTSNEAIQKASGKVLTFGSKPAYVDITFDESLVSGKTWGVALTP